MINRLYRSRKGKILGVCQGIADWKDLPVRFIRIGFIFGAIFLNIPMVIVYLILAFILDPTPRETNRDNNFKPKDENTSFKSRFNSMKEDLNRKERDWEDRFNDTP
jgi:phage shock protein C